MTQAALTQADGRMGEALGLLRSAQSRLFHRMSEVFASRVGELEKREQSLRHDGVGADFKSEIASMRTQFESGQRLDSIELLVATDGRLAHLESDWSGLRSLLAQIDTLREAAHRMGTDLPEVEQDVAQVRALLGEIATNGDALDKSAQIAARALMLLHEALPPILEEELVQQNQRLTRVPPEHEGGRRARSLHAEASRHLRRGRLTDASSRLKELREVLETLPTAPPRAEPVATEPPRLTATIGAGGRTTLEPTPPAPGEALGRLLLKARELAARVRSLPQDSEVAFEAAAEIRRATELLRSRKLEEAESTLARLMRTLDAEHPDEE